ncbi:hypothetical protein RE428_32350 [Marinobacter nanhaiticus D15-8W]|uniref:DUF3850 domain-containing protein n=1 Tax=Marinobacter nanhaiticus TaxID=1305740 RepID=UPI0002CBD5F9|nr:DUF3850 domain-containing protein [Marinobacter nanhaiticus]BES72217.1 hypothetical protein RE428_32350 [Marinobacter nanhaiticus D15-8W]
MHHDLKILPCYFHAVERGDKTFEIRDDRDRGFQAGDTVALHEFDSKARTIESQQYTGRVLLRKITYVTAFEQKPGFVVFAHVPEQSGGGE